jgi:hypothetical protein
MQRPFPNGHSPTNTSVRSGVTVMQRPWPLVKASGYILVWGSLTGIISQFAPSGPAVPGNGKPNTSEGNYIPTAGSRIVDSQCTGNDVLLLFAQPQRGSGSQKLKVQVPALGFEPKSATPRAEERAPTTRPPSTYFLR